MTTKRIDFSAPATIQSKRSGEYEYQAQMGIATAYFNDPSESYTHLVRVESVNSSIRMNMRGATPTRIEIKNNVATYVDAFDGVDIIYTVNGGLLKEDVVIHRPEAIRPFILDLQQERVNVHFNEDGSFDYTTPEETPLWTVESPYAYDANEQEIDVEVIYDGHCYTYTLLMDGTEVYPLTLDPTIIMPSTTYLASTSGSGAYASGFNQYELFFDKLGFVPDTISLQASYYAQSAVKTTYSISGNYYYYVQYRFRDKDGVNLGVTEYLTTSSLTEIVVPPEAMSLFVYAYRGNATSNASMAALITAGVVLAGLTVTDPAFKEYFLGSTSSSTSTSFSLTAVPSDSYTVKKVFVLTTAYSNYGAVEATISNITVNGAPVTLENFAVKPGDTVVISGTKPSTHGYIPYITFAGDAASSQSGFILFGFTENILERAVSVLSLKERTISQGQSEIAVKETIQIKDEHLFSLQENSYAQGTGNLGVSEYVQEKAVATLAFQESIYEAAEAKLSLNEGVYAAKEERLLLQTNIFGADASLILTTEMIQGEAKQDLVLSEAVRAPEGRLLPIRAFIQAKEEANLPLLEAVYGQQYEVFPLFESVQAKDHQTLALRSDIRATNESLLPISSFVKGSGSELLSVPEMICGKEADILVITEDVSSTPFASLPLQETIYGQQRNIVPLRELVTIPSVPNDLLLLEQVRGLDAFDLPLAEHVLGVKSQLLPLQERIVILAGNKNSQDRVNMRETIRGVGVEVRENVITIPSEPVRLTPKHAVRMKGGRYS